MRILFATIRAHVPERQGGGQQSIHGLLTRLQLRGHECEAVVVLHSPVRLVVDAWMRRLPGGRWIGWHDWRNGYATFRAPETLVEQLACARMDAAGPDVVVADFHVTNTIADAALRRGIPALLRIISPGCLDRQVPISRDPCLQPYANSAFMARRLRAEYGLEAPVIYPLIELERFRAASRSPEFVTFINPIPVKGVETALGVAEVLRHRRFLFVEGVPLCTAERASLDRRLTHLPNVTFVPPQRDMRCVYGRTAVLIVPSQWDEAFGRVVIEAQANGIPVVARAVGGLPEAVGLGGILLGRNDRPEDWAAHVEVLLTDHAHCERLAALALANVCRPELQPDDIVDRFLQMAGRHARRAGGGRPSAATGHACDAGAVGRGDDTWT